MGGRLRAGHDNAGSTLSQPQRDERQIAVAVDEQELDFLAGFAVGFDVMRDVVG